MKKIIQSVLIVPFLLLMVVGFFLFSLLDQGEGNPSPLTPGIGTATVPPEVLKWEPLVRKYAQEFGVEPYVPLMLSLILQESGGRLLDVMQSAEGAFNTKYPKIQNGIPDPDYSIWCGVQEFKHSITIANVQGPSDINRIKLALQTYNFGPGFLNYINSNGGEYSLELAKSFALKMANGRTECGFRSPFCYGDFSYVEKILKYYTVNAEGGTGNVVLGAGDGPGDSMANQKFNEIMSLISPYDGYPYVFGGRKPPYFDCSGLIEWSYNQLGIRISGTAADMYNQTVPVDKPAPGDLVFFSNTYKPGISHIGVYIGNNKMFNAGGTHLHYADLSQKYWAEHFSGIRRVK
ncbi:glycoside hydrolase (plasmid) [Bacillus mycoides]|uniref:bifunctional lytic transglycosylase/C40 family peptidase n=1 Tax=Bacillus mycoides TaxID=1405 RepID=UPI001C00B614|nr:bifunctional lytic transglycosylase/C40 family peptidase [Bacillus mycoides]QWH75354.1 glycoside hydrolase [Bacillus mycoides]QWH76102.1 glycoside hydrolase [Bacillus mycoides]QWI47281.1 glycoside hydrolase [Bacillus mycoides]